MNDVKDLPKNTKFEFLDFESVEIEWEDKKYGLNRSFSFSFKDWYLDFRVSLSGFYERHYYQVRRTGPMLWYWRYRGTLKESFESPLREYFIEPEDKAFDSLVRELEVNFVKGLYPGHISSYKDEGGKSKDILRRDCENQVIDYVVEQKIYGSPGDFVKAWQSKKAEIVSWQEIPFHDAVVYLEKCSLERSLNLQYDPILEKIAQLDANISKISGSIFTSAEKIALNTKQSWVWRLLGR